MKNSVRAFYALMCSALIVVAGAGSVQASPVTQSTAAQSPIVDNADVLSPAEETALANAIKANHAKYDLFFAVETTPSLNGQSIEAAALARAKEMGLGDADKDNGVFILLSRDDRQVRFELGSGVSGNVTDAEATNIIASVVTPQFKEGKYSFGLEAGMSAVGNEYIGASTEFDPNQITQTFAVIFGIFVLGYFLIYAGNQKWGEPARIRQRERERRESIARLEKMTAYARGMKYSINYSGELKEYSALPNEQARFAYIESKYPDLADTIKKHMSSETPSTRIIDRSFYDDTNGFFVSWGGKSTSPMSLRNYKLVGKGFEEMSIDEANHIIRTEKEKYEKTVMASRQAAKRRKEKAQKVWDSIPEKKKKELKKARTERERLAIHNSTDFVANYAAIASMFLSSGSSGNTSSGSSGSSRSGGSGNGYGSGGSYGSGGGGGTFDGGGGSGSW